MKKIITATLLLLAVQASANTDYTCYSRCIDEGSRLEYCRKLCEF